jgi:hypothetical protein
MKLHEPIDVDCEPVYTILHNREFFIHFLAERSKFKTDQIESPVRLPKSSSNDSFERRELLIDGSSFYCRFLLGHLSYLAALSLDESQDLKPESLDHFIRLHQRPLRNRQTDLLRCL